MLLLGGKQLPTIIGIKLSERNKESIKLQEILTKYGCNISTRIGLHHSTGDACSNSGMILLDTVDDPAELVSELKMHWEVQQLIY